MALNPQRRQHILRAATDVFCQYGYGRTSMDTVARAAGVSKATLYNHFGSKDELFGAVVEAVSQQFIAQVGAPERQTQTLSDALMHIGRGFLDMLLDPHNLAAVRLIIGEVQSCPQVGQRFYAAGPARALKAMEEFFAERFARGQWPEPDAEKSARHFVAMLRGNLFWQALLGLPFTPEDRERQVRQSVELFLKAMTRQA